jgi:DNA-binding NtrC family response regulator
MNYARILVVEDQDDVRRLLVTALEIEGHVVDEAADARGGLKRLQEARYDLVLSDYAMPGGTGSWMLQEATAQGLLNETIALIVTAHPDVRELRAARVIPKPLDLDHFLEQVRRLLNPQLDSDKTPDGTHRAATRGTGLVRQLRIGPVDAGAAQPRTSTRELRRVADQTLDLRSGPRSAGRRR